MNLNISTINVATICDKNYFNHTLVTLFSMIRRSSNHITVYFIYDKIPDIDLVKAKELFINYQVDFKFINYNHEKYLHYHRDDSIYPTTVYVKFDLPNLLDSIKHVIYLDSDIVVNDKIGNLWQLFDDKYSLMAVSNPPFPKWKDRDTIKLDSNKKSFNTGVLLLNLEKLRHNRTTNILFDFADKNYRDIKLPDEAAFNYVFQDDWKELPYQFNVTTLFFRRSYKILRIEKNEYDAIIHSPSIVHYTGRDKPWSYYSPHPLNNLWRKEYQLLFNNPFDYHVDGFSKFKKVLRKMKFLISYYRK